MVQNPGVNRAAYLLSHLGVLAGAFCLGWVTVEYVESAREGRHALPSKTPRLPSVSSEEALGLLEEFLPGNAAVDRSRYERVRETLDGLEDNEGRLREMLANLPTYYLPKEGPMPRSARSFGASALTEIEGEEGELIAEFEARIDYWLRTDRDACMMFMAEHLQVQGHFGNHPICQTVLRDYLTQGELVERLRWVHVHVPSIVDDLVREKISNGADFELLYRLADAGVRDAGYWVRSVAQVLPFSNREQVLAHAIGSDEPGASGMDPSALVAFLGNPDHPPEEMMSWVNELIDEERLPDGVRRRVASEVISRIRAADSLSYEERVATLEKWGAKPKSPHGDLAARDVKRLLDAGRDWSFAYQHGRVSASEVWDELSGQLPEMNPEAEKAARVRLFRTLAEENLMGAMVLIEPYADEERLQILSESMWRSFLHVHPEKLVELGQFLPPTETPEIRRNRIKAWEQKTPRLMRRFGEDYVEWVLQMPNGPDRKEARRGLIWQTMKIDPEQGERLRRRLEVTP